MDFKHTFGGDLQLDPTGKIAQSDGIALSQERVIRRLLTNQGGDSYNTGYGGGLLSAIGAPANPARLTAGIRSQMALETGVDQTQPVNVNVYRDQAGTNTFASITYISSETGKTYQLSPIQVG